MNANKATVEIVGVDGAILAVIPLSGRSRATRAAVLEEVRALISSAPVDERHVPTELRRLARSSAQLER